MDVLEVERVARGAACFVREAQAPFFLELQTYRFRAHSMFDAELYRDRAEVERWKARDPVTALAARLKEGGQLDDATLAELEREVAAEVQEAVAFADAGTLEPVEDLEKDVMAEASPS
jgi:TPP-dependent pyruvate/acetoin dehydrogenase alpha subunit